MQNTGTRPLLITDWQRIWQFQGKRESIAFSKRGLDSVHANLSALAGERKGKLGWLLLR